MKFESRCLCSNQSVCLYCRTFMHLKERFLVDEFDHWDIVSHSIINGFCFYARLTFTPLSGYHFSWERLDTIANDEFNLYVERFYKKHKYHSKCFSSLFEFFEVTFEKSNFCSSCEYSKEFYDVFNLGSIKPENQLDLDKQLNVFINEYELRRNFGLKIRPQTFFISFNRIKISFSKEDKHDISVYIERYLDLNRIVNRDKESARAMPTNLKKKVFSKDEDEIFFY